MSRQAIASVRKSKDTAFCQEELRKPQSVRRPLFASSPKIDQELMEHMQFARSKRVPVPRFLVQDRARMEPTRHNLFNF